MLCASGASARIASAVTRRRAAKMYLETYLFTHSCEECGSQHLPSAMRFHHRGRTKPTKTLTQIAHDGACRETLRREIERHWAVLCWDCRDRRRLLDAWRASGAARRGVAVRLPGTGRRTHARGRLLRWGAAVSR